MMYLVTNRLATSLVIEDIGIRLEPAGGTASSKLLTEQTYRVSHKLKEYEQRKWIAIAVRNSPPPKAPIPIWPFSASPAQPPSPPPISAESTALHTLVAKLEAIVQALQAPLVAASRTPAPTPATVYQAAASLPRVTPSIQASDEPIFIPKQIMPTSADVSINVATSETDREDYDADLKALKSARKKR